MSEEISRRTRGSRKFEGRYAYNKKSKTSLYKQSKIQFEYNYFNKCQEYKGLNTSGVCI